MSKEFDTNTSTDIFSNNDNVGVIQSMLRAAYEDCQLCSWQWDIETHELYWLDENLNQNTLKTDRKTLLSQTGLFGSIHSEDIEKVDREIDDLEINNSSRFDYRCKSENGIELKWAWVYMIKDGQQKPLCIKGTLQNITPHKRENVHLRQMNAALEQSEKLARLGNWQFNLSTKKYLYSGNLYKIFGVKNNSFEPGFANFLKFVHPDDAVKIPTVEDLIRHPEEALETEYRIITARGETVHVKSISKIIANLYGERVILGTLQDVTTEVILMQHLEEKALLNQLIFDNSVDNVFACDNNLLLTAWNRKCEEKYKLKKEEVIGKHISGVFNGDGANDLLDDLKNALTGREIHREGKTDNNNIFYDRFTLPLKNGGGRIFGVLCISHDMTAIKSVTNKLVELNNALEQKNEMLEQSNNELASFSYVASHDLQEPLRKIQTFTSRIMEKDYQVLSAQGIEYFRRMEAAAKRMQILIDDHVEIFENQYKRKGF